MSIKDEFTSAVTLIGEIKKMKNKIKCIKNDVSCEEKIKKKIKGIKYDVSCETYVNDS